MNEQLQKTSGADALTSRKKSRKTLGGVLFPHPHPIERPRNNIFCFVDRFYIKVQMNIIKL